MNTPVHPPHGRYRAVATLARMLCAVVACLAIVGCAIDALDRAPSSALEPWRPAQVDPLSNMTGSNTDAAGPEGFGVRADPRIAEMQQGPDLVPDTVYSLAQLIDIAQREHPSTRMAWNRARQAALAVGVAEATFLPRLTANIIGGWQRTSTPSPLTFDGRLSDIETNLQGAAPFLALEWLLFDFGQRQALTEAAEHAFYAANVLYNGVHQRIIHDVTHAFYTYAAAHSRLKIAEQALVNSRRVLEAVQQRLQAGLATTVELALARQQVAQAELRRVNAQGVERNTFQGLLAAAGLPPTSRIRIGGLKERELPRTTTALAQDAIRGALARRPDLQASYAALAAAKAGVTAAEADFLPKVYLAAIAGGNRNRFEVGHLPGIQHRSSTSAVLVGVTVPLYDAGMRAARLKDAEIHVDNARKTFEEMQRDIVREIVLAESTLRSALESYDAASELVEVASVAHDAALEAYQHGVGTITVVTETATSLLDAREARSDAYAASLSAAANLAFVMGKMTSDRESWIN